MKTLQKFHNSPVKIDKRFGCKWSSGASWILDEHWLTRILVPEGQGYWGGGGVLIHLCIDNGENNVFRTIAYSSQSMNTNAKFIRPNIILTI